METTLTMAGQQAVAGAARLRVAAPGHHAAACAHGSSVAAPAVSGSASAVHQPTTWIEGVFAKPVTVMVLDRKNRPSRLLPERSP